MSIDINNALITSFLVLTSGLVAANTDKPDDRLHLVPQLPTSLLTLEIANSRSGNKYSFRADSGKDQAQCRHCVPVGAGTDSAFTPVTAYLSFAAVADPQINLNNDGRRAARENKWATEILNDLYNDDSYKGLIVAGDLTQNASQSEILEFYNAMLAEEQTQLGPILDHRQELDRLYEGLGNHDMKEGICCLASESGGNCGCEDDLLKIIERGERQDQVRSQPPHYSWEWDGIRFIQLNLMPADEPETVWNGSGRDPQDALTFLEAELNDIGPEKNVILVHHYGMDSFSAKWWSIDAKKAYEEAISGYRVVAIITGHLHWTEPLSNLQQCWNGVTAIAAGAARLGFYLDFKVVNDQLTVTRLVNGVEQWNDTYHIGQAATTFCGDNT